MQDQIMKAIRDVRFVVFIDKTSFSGITLNRSRTAKQTKFR